MVAMVEAQNLTLQFGARRALDGLTLTVNEGETYGLIGPNGAGKTTLIRAIAGLIAPTVGTLTVLDQRMPSRGIASHIGYMTQLEALYNDLTVAENLRSSPPCSACRSRCSGSAWRNCSPSSISATGRTRLSAHSPAG